MPWQTITISNEEANALMRGFPTVCRFLVDATLGRGFALALRSLGYDATDAFALKLDRRTNEDVYAAAWKQHRMLLTQNRAFLDERRFPGNCNPGLVVLPPNSNDALVSALMSALSVVVQGRRVLPGVKILVGENGRLTVTSYNRTTGVEERTYYKLRMAGPPLVWHRASSNKSPLPY